jgi:hypothetical protein
MATPIASSDLSAGSYTPEQRYADSGEIKTLTQTIAKVSAGAVIPAGTVLGKVTASGKLIPCLSGAVDGSNIPCAILPEAVNTVPGDVNFAVYIQGDFNLDWVVFDASFSTEALKLAAFPLNSGITVQKLGYSG